MWSQRASFLVPVTFSSECDECLRYRPGKHPRCLNYNGDVDWKPNYIACKFFTDEKEDEIKGQIDIFDLLQNKVID